MGYIIEETQWDGVDGHDAAIAHVQTDDWWQARFEYLFKAAYGAISTVPYHTIEMKQKNGDRVEIVQYTPDRLERLNQGGGSE